MLSSKLKWYNCETPFVPINCNEEGHIGSQCTQPKKAQTSGRVFALTCTQTDNEDRLIRGTCFFNGTPLIAIIDTGATHCFILIVQKDWV